MSTSRLPPAKPWETSSNSRTSVASPGASPELPSRDSLTSYNRFGRSLYDDPYDGPSRFGSRYGGYGSGYGGYDSYDRFGSRYGSGYGSYGGYGGYGGYDSYDRYGSRYGGLYGNSYGGSYGGYGSSYGGRLMDRPGDPRDPHWVQNGFGWIGGLHSLTDGFTRFSDLLMANTNAVHSVFSSMVGLYQLCGNLYQEIAWFAGGVALFKFLQNFFRWVLGKYDPETEVMKKTFRNKTELLLGNSASELPNRKRGVGWPTLLALLVVATVGAPVLISLFNKIFRRDKKYGPQEGQQQQQLLKALYNFNGESRDDLKFAKGDLIVLLGKPAEKWWEGEILRGPFAGMRGLFPANYVEIIDQDSKKNSKNKKNGRKTVIEEIDDEDDQQEEAEEEREKVRRMITAGSRRPRSLSTSSTTQQRQQQQLQQLQQLQRRNSTSTLRKHSPPLDEEDEEEELSQAKQQLRSSSKLPVSSSYASRKLPSTSRKSPSQSPVITTTTATPSSSSSSTTGRKSPQLSSLPPSSSSSLYSSSSLSVPPPKSQRQQQSPPLTELSSTSAPLKT